MNSSKMLGKIERLYELFQQGKIEKLVKHEVHPNLEKGSRENYLYFTLPPAINFQRSSPAMWQAALKTWSDSKTNYLFFPEKIARKSFGTIQKDLLKYNLALQRNKHTEIWIKISHTLNKYFDNDPKKVLETGEFDIEQILKLIQTDQKEHFPYLRGVKMANYWLYVLSEYTDVQLRNINSISIIPDTHVMQSSVKLGLAKSDAKPEAVALVWKSLLANSKINPIDMHPVLWNWSRNNFIPEV